MKWMGEMFSRNSRHQNKWNWQLSSLIQGKAKGQSHLKRVLHGKIPSHTKVTSDIFHVYVETRTNVCCDRFGAIHKGYIQHVVYCTCNLIWINLKSRGIN